MLPAEDPEALRAERTAAAALTAAALGYLVTTAGRVGLVFYLPTQHRWALAAPDGVVAMDWFARAGWTFLACALGALLGSRVGTVQGRRAARTTRTLWGIGGLLWAWAALYTGLWLFHVM